ncbi:hypothetical protein ACERK3_18125 [Phycisphaerales bacterium AB-hyl4]|uniref:Uncharacterized protein n=1 Tax=Natronomicrosphaera hydrolytica TaxID=3242702 RepID=A0ABV4UB84_9BACT
MHSMKYLNGVLTVLAVVLTLNLWVALTDSDTAASDRLTMTQQAHAQAAGPPNSAQQRREMIDAIKQTNTQLAELKSLLTSGEVRVRAELPARDDAGE